MKRLLFLLIPILTPVLVYQMMPYLVKLSLEYRSSVYLFPYLVFVTTTILAWRFNRSRIFFSTLLILLVYVALKMSHGLTDLIQLRLLFLVSLLLPLNMLLFGLLKERGIFTQHGLLWFAILAAQGALVWWTVNDENMPGLEYLSAPWLPFPTFIDTQSGISQLGWLVVLGVSIWFIIKLMMHPKLFESSMLAALALLMLAINKPVDTTSMVLFFGFAGMLLLITLIQDSYGMAYMDELTGLPGRRALKNTLMSMGKCYSVAMLDIDHFKKFNDAHGHDIGDQVLRKVAAQIGKVTGGAGQSGLKSTNSIS